MDPDHEIIYLKGKVIILEGALEYKDKREAELLGQIKDLQECLDMIAEDSIEMQSERQPPYLDDYDDGEVDSHN